MIKYCLKMFVIVVINLTIHPPQVTFLSPKLRSFGQHHESRALAENKTGSPIKIDFRL